MTFARPTPSLLPLVLPLELPAELDLAIPLAILRLAPPSVPRRVPPAGFGRPVLVVEHPVTRAEWARRWARRTRLVVLVEEFSGTAHRAMLIEPSAKVQYLRAGPSWINDPPLGSTEPPLPSIG